MSADSPEKIVRKQAQRAWVTQFLHKHHLPDSFIHIIDSYYAPLGQWLVKQCRPLHPLFVGINGAQGTGKSTLAAFLQAYLKQTYKLKVATVSIDDFYLSREVRRQLALRVHPLLATRGVPGTHDLELALTTLNALKSLRGDESLALPRFDKACDDHNTINGSPNSISAISRHAPTRCCASTKTMK